MLPRSIITFLAGAAYVKGAAIERRGTVPHDSIWPFDEFVPPGSVGDAVRKFEPYLHIASGCQPYTAVNWEGDTSLSAGLRNSGSASGDCRDTRRGQTYARAAWHNNRFAIMYAWYMPKDMSADGAVVGSHRHDWENVVIWIDNPDSQNLIGGAASGHGRYKKTTNPERQGSRPKVEYFSNYPTNHELQFTGTLGRDYNMVYWDSISQAARVALDTTDFGAANVPFNDGNFIDNLNKAAM